MSAGTAVVLGGYGSFGSLVCQALARCADVHVIVAGRDLGAAAALCSRLGPRAQPQRIDVEEPALERRFAALQASVIINTVGPFQTRDYRVPRAAIAAGAHYVDLADARGFVHGIHELHAPAAGRGVLVVSGASTCPALSTAVIDEITAGWTGVERISFGVAPGLRQARGLATARAVLGYCGKPIPVLRAGAVGTVPGWSGLARHRYPPPLGPRWLSRVDLPEQDLWPGRYPALRDLECRAGLQPAALHLSLTALAWLVRVRLIGSLAQHAARLLRMSTWLERFGTDAGAMYLRVEGLDGDGQRTRRVWTIIAERGDGPWIPAAPAIALTKRLLGVAGHAPLTIRGAMPCIGLLSRAQILAELAGLAIRTQLD